MHLEAVDVRNFRLLENVALEVEPTITVIVGRNNCGKTSLTELFRRLSADRAPRFRLEDFCLNAHSQFWTAFQLYIAKKAPDEIRAALPIIEIRLKLRYSIDDDDLGHLSEFIIDTNVDCTQAIALIRFSPMEGVADKFFAGIDAATPEMSTKFFREVRNRVEKYYASTLVAEDPNDPLNQRDLEFSDLRALIQGDFISAQRGLDDVTHKDTNLLGQVLEALLTAAMAESAKEDDQSIATLLETAVEAIQANLDNEFQTHLSKLWPTLADFGYPGLGQQRLTTETMLDVERLLRDHTSVKYEGAGGLKLPESYNGLGTRNLVFMLLKLFEYFKKHQSGKAPSIHLVFIEEPEVHLHPQMQEVFINQLSGIAESLSKSYGAQSKWPVQFVVTTHSSHLANKASFDSIRYFMCRPMGGNSRTTAVKNLRSGLASMSPESREFLHKYMTLTRCDLLFADKAILIEGAAERILLPAMIAKCDTGETSRLSTQYVTAMEVGGAHAHVFFPLLEFLELPTLVITDIDTVGADKKKCCVSSGVRSSNTCINGWFDGTSLSVVELHSKSEADRTKKLIRLAFQVPEKLAGPCARSFEDAFIIANAKAFGLSDSDESSWEELACEEAAKHGKTDFAIQNATTNSDWSVPKYISDGLRWLADADPFSMSFVAPIGGGSNGGNADRGKPRKASSKPRTKKSS